MAIEYMSFEDVLGELQIDEEELKKLVSQGELRGFRDGLSMKFKKDDVLNLKQGRETEPTIILTDSDQEMGIAESSDELILEDSTSDTVINIGDIMSPGGAKGQAGAKGKPPAPTAPSSGSNVAAASDQQEIIFDTTEEQYTVSPHDSDPEAAIPTVEVPSVSEDIGPVATESDAQLVEVGSDESMETEAFELMDESGETDGSVAVAAGPSGSKRASRKAPAASARMRSLAMEQRRTHTFFSAVLLLSVVFLAISMGVLLNQMQGTSPAWLDDWTSSFRGMTEGIFGGFVS